MRKAALLIIYIVLLPWMGGMFPADQSPKLLSWSVTTAFAQDGDPEEKQDRPPLLTRLYNWLMGINTGEEEQKRKDSLFEQYDFIFNYIHQEELAYYDSLRNAGVVEWDDFYRPDIVYRPYRIAEHIAIDSSMKVFGWHPYWMGSAYESYNFQLLTHVSWFSYNLDAETGSYDNPEVIELWNTTPLLDSAQAHNCKVLLCVTSHQRAGNRLFLDNATDQQQTLIDSLTTLIEKRGAHGVDLNFENLPIGYEKKLTAFIKKLSRALRKQDPDYLLSVTLPKINTYRDPARQKNQRKFYEVDALRRYVAFFVITGYDFHNGRSATDGPVAPLYSNGDRYSIENVVFAYLEEGLPRKQLLLGLPYYGASWKAPDDDPYSSASVFDRHITYREMKTLLPPDAKSQPDSLSWSNYWVFTDTTLATQSGPSPTGYAYRKYWFDDSLTLAKKYAWVIDQDLGGVGIWALGYDNNQVDLWQLLESRFTPGSIEAYRTPPRAGFSLFRLLFKYRYVLLVSALFIAGFLLIGFIAALFDWRVREVFFSNKTLRLLYIVGGALVLFALFFFTSSDSGGLFAGSTPARKALLFILGLSLGAALTIFVVRVYSRQRERLP